MGLYPVDFFLFQTHVLFMTIYCLKWSSSVNGNAMEQRVVGAGWGDCTVWSKLNKLEHVQGGRGIPVPWTPMSP